MTFYGRSEELVSRCVECDLAEPESLASLGGSAPGVVDGILSKVFENVFLPQVLWYATHHSHEDQSGCSRMVQNAFSWMSTDDA